MSRVLFRRKWCRLWHYYRDKPSRYLYYCWSLSSSLPLIIGEVRRVPHKLRWSGFLLDAAGLYIEHTNRLPHRPNRDRIGLPFARSYIRKCDPYTKNRRKLVPSWYNQLDHTITCAPLDKSLPTPRLSHAWMSIQKVGVWTISDIVVQDPIFNAVYIDSEVESVDRTYTRNLIFISIITGTKDWYTRSRHRELRE